MEVCGVEHLCIFERLKGRSQRIHMENEEEQGDEGSPVEDLMEASLLGLDLNSHKLSEVGKVQRTMQAI